MVRDNCVGLLARFEELLGGEHLSERLPIFVHVENRILDAVVRIVLLRVRAAHERVGADLQLVAVAHLLLFVPVEGGTRETDHDDDHAEVNDVTAITPGIAMRELHHRGEQTLTGVSFDHSAASNEFRNHGEPYQRGKHDRH